MFCSFVRFILNAILVHSNVLNRLYCGLLNIKVHFPFNSTKFETFSIKQNTYTHIDICIFILYTYNKICGIWHTRYSGYLRGNNKILMWLISNFECKRFLPTFNDNGFFLWWIFFHYFRNFWKSLINFYCQLLPFIVDTNPSMYNTHYTMFFFFLSPFLSIINQTLPWKGWEGNLHISMFAIFKDSLLQSLWIRQFGYFHYIFEEQINFIRYFHKSKVTRIHNIRSFDKIHTVFELFSLFRLSMIYQKEEKMNRNHVRDYG